MGGKVSTTSVDGNSNMRKNDAMISTKKVFSARR